MNIQNSSREPRVAVLASTYNDGELLTNALNSIGRNSKGITFVIVDDGSSTPFNYTSDSHEVFIIRILKNAGLTNALNEGLDFILEHSFDYVMRIDSDDWCTPDRLIKQLKFLASNPDIDGVGSYAEFVEEESGRTLFFFNPSTDPEKIRRKLHLNSCLLHPTWFMRVQVFKRYGKYNPSFAIAQDYEFLMRATSIGARFANIDEYLVKYQISSAGISERKRRAQLKSRLRVQISYFNYTYWESYFGLLKTLILWYAPLRLIKSIKALLPNYERK